MLVGLTGGIASGKSLVTAELERLGAAVEDADRVYHDLLETDLELRERLVLEFGPEFLCADGRLDRRKLGALVFSDPVALGRLNRMTHPAVRSVLERRMSATGTGLLYLSVPLLIENGLDARMDRIVVVYCTRDQQIARLAARGGLSVDESARRVDAQLPLEEKRRHAHRVIDNTGTVDATLEQVRAMHREYGAGRQ
ncbi:MAG: dephospho-CoA kinase [Candidatus Riflebacteria bacterium]|nr:dephospho-CoA kinase [Candidatus Riflebacteria bacterium]